MHPAFATVSNLKPNGNAKMKHDLIWLYFIVIVLSGVAGVVHANAAIDVRVEGCFRQQGSNNVTCRLTINNRSHVTAKTAFNTSNNRRVSGLDQYCSWAWDNSGQQYQIVDARIGIGQTGRWRVPFEVPGDLRIPAEITVSEVAPTAKSLTRLTLNFSPGLPVWKGIETFEFKNVSID
jgi:hypothetical protein